MKIAFRVDASIDIGSGHVMRCLTLANMLKLAGGECHFLCRDHEGNLSQRLRSMGHSVKVLENFSRTDFDLPHSRWLGATQERDALQCSEFLAAIKPTWLIVDHYALDSRWESVVRAQAKKMFVIDDLANRRHQGDLLLDQNLGRELKDYDGLVPHDCLRLIGLDYALLRPEFYQWRGVSLARRKRLCQVESVMINLGGVDKENLSACILDSLYKSGWLSRFVVSVVLGSSAPRRDRLAEKVAHLNHVLPKRTDGRPRIEMALDVANMAERLAKVDFVIGAAGSSTWERCCLGVPSAFLRLESNQDLAADVLLSRKISLEIHRNRLDEGLSALFDDICSNPGCLSEMSERASALLDGRGAERVVNILLGTF